MSAPERSEGQGLRGWGSALLLLLGLVSLAFGLVSRFLAHPGYLHDPESLMVPTIGRELAHGHFVEIGAYQYNLYQGALLLDGSLSALGFRLFGDSLWAWRGYTIGYGILIGLFGALLLRRLGNSAGGVLFLLSMAVAPFLLQDGLITPAGHHSSAVLWALVALWAAAGGGERPGLARGLLCGLLLALGVFYTRTTAAAAPAVGLLLWRGGWRPIAGAALGGLVFLPLSLLGALLVLRHSPALEGNSLLDLTRHVIVAVRGVGGESAFAAKALESVGAPLGPWLYLQPLVPRFGEAPEAPVFGLAGLLWVGFWVAAAASGMLWLLWLLGRNRAAALRPDGRLGLALAPWLLAFGYSALYVMSPFRVDEGWLAQTGVPGAIAPGVDPPRYLLPSLLAWTLAGSHLLGLLWRFGGWRRGLGALLALALLAPSLRATAIDRAEHAEAPERRAELRPYEYLGMFHGGRGPGLSSHLSCGTRDPVSRANHLRSAAWMPGVDLEAWRSPGRVDALVDEIRSQASYQSRSPLSADELLFVVHGLGTAFTNQLAMEGPDVTPSNLALALERAAELPEDQRVAFEAGLLLGLTRLLLGDLPREPHKMAAWSRQGAEPGRPGPLASLPGFAFVDPSPWTLPERPEDLFGASLPPPGAYREAWLEGAGQLLGRSAPWLEPPATALWPADDVEAFARGWDRARVRARWRAGDPWTPELVP